MSIRPYENHEKPTERAFEKLSLPAKKPARKLRREPGDRQIARTLNNLLRGGRP